MANFRGISNVCPQMSDMRSVSTTVYLEVSAVRSNSLLFVLFTTASAWKSDRLAITHVNSNTTNSAGNIPAAAPDGPFLKYPSGIKTTTTIAPIAEVSISCFCRPAAIKPNR